MVAKYLILISVISSIYASSNTLKSNQCMAKFEKLESSNGCFRLELQGDGNLVLYRTKTGSAHWSTRTNGMCVNKACMESDGNFVVLDCKDKHRWASQTYGHSGAYMMLQDDGNLIIFGEDNVPIWSSRTVGKC